ncbi:hypothetical protein QVD17_20771 [Tagetes erecta]|uniref:RING-type E3 ubiquitin transferase n=1 Tax=Tagetes erecta TaxID=13708 RepID=A0AAD8NYE3_TARER|nr:hypothetical protein QVD17_20771 [Tagetes erecta]
MAETEAPVPEINIDIVTGTDTVNDPLLSSSQVTVPSLSGTRDRASTRFSMLLGFVHSRRGADELRMVVRQNVAEEMENWREEWGNSLPVVVLDTLWNLAFAVVSFGAFLWIEPEEVATSERERKLEQDLQVWILGYSFLCVFYVMFLWTEYITNRRGVSTAPIETPMLPPPQRSNLRRNSDDEAPPGRTASLQKKLTVEECASEAEINNLPKYIFEVANGDVEQHDVTACKMIPMETNGPNFSTERVLLAEEVDCCICLSHYEDREELRSLPCNHHFHSKCIAKWLRVKATCPQCKSLIA